MSLVSILQTMTISFCKPAQISTLVLASITNLARRDLIDKDSGRTLIEILSSIYMVQYISTLGADLIQILI